MNDDINDNKPDELPEDLESLAIEGEALSGGDESHVNSSSPEPGIQTAVLLMPIINVVFDGIYTNWNVSQKEKELLANAYADVIDKYFPDITIGVELNAVLATAIIIGPRLRTPGRTPTETENKDENEQAKQTNNSGQFPLEGTINK